jgi:hypothetical protein
MEGDAQVEALRLLLLHPPPGREFSDALFYYESRLRASLRSLVYDRTVGKAALDALVLSGEPDDLRFLIQHSPVPRDDLNWRWSYKVACSLLDPSTEVEWSVAKRLSGARLGRLPAPSRLSN